jgi:hypothetical protein
MDHDMVVRDKMTEKYLLKELDPTLRDEFEEHFFDCPECAQDIRAGTEFVLQSKAVLAERTEPVAGREGQRLTDPIRRGWLAWLRPAFMVPVFAILLAAIGYQNFVTFPHLRETVNKAQVLPAATVNLLTYGENASPLVVHEGGSFLLNVIIPPGHRYTGYRVDLYKPGGGLEESLTVPASAEDTWPIRFSAANRQNGTYKLTVHGTGSNGQDVEVGSSSFELQVQK